MSRDYTRQRLRSLLERLHEGKRLGDKDVSIVSCVPRYELATRVVRYRGRTSIEVRIKVRGHWSSWLDGGAAARRLRDAGFVDAAVALLSSGQRIDERLER